MLETGIALASLGYSIEKLGGKELLIKLFGPSMDALGEKLAARFNKTCDNALSKIDSHNIPAKNTINISIINHLKNEWVYDDDDIFSEYYGGVLASSKMRQDDLGKTIGHTINRLSLYALRFHFIVYNSMRNTFLGEDLNIGASKICDNSLIIINKSDMDKAMGFTDLDKENNNSIYSNCLTTLTRENLLHNRYRFGESFKQLMFCYKWSQIPRGLADDKPLGS